MAVMPNVVRGCGTRIAGGVYLEVTQGPGGSPVEFFLQDPPRPIPFGLGLSPIGVHFVQEESTGLWHVFDVVGSEHYPNVTDFVEEVRRYGVSRRIARTAEFEKLGPGSRLVLLHQRAILGEPMTYLDTVPAGDGDSELVDRMRCPKGISTHLPEPHCAGLWWVDVPETELDLDPDSPPRVGTRSFCGWNYRAARPPETSSGKHTLGVFAVFPIAQIGVVRDRAGGSHEQSQKQARRSGLPVELEEA